MYVFLVQRVVVSERSFWVFPRLADCCPLFLHGVDSPVLFWPACAFFLWEQRRCSPLLERHFSHWVLVPGSKYVAHEFALSFSMDLANRFACSSGRFRVPHDSLCFSVHKFICVCSIYECGRDF